MESVILPTDALVAIAPLEPGYAALLAAVAGRASADERVRGLWLGGSVARRVADAGSDLDLLVAVADAAWPALAELLAELAQPLEVVHRARIPNAPQVFAATTRGGLRCDLVAEPVSALGDTAYRHRILVLDKDGLSPTPPGESAGAAPDVERLTGLVAEALRQAALFPAAVVARQDWLLGQVGVGNQVRLLYDVFVESAQPLPPSGIKQWSSKLRPEHRAILEGLPAAAATRESVVLAMTAAVETLLGEGRRVLEHAGGTWPGEFGDVVVTTWVRHQLPDPSPLA